MVNSNCEICCETTGSSSEKVIRCSGPCGKEFHAFCTELNLSYWKAWNARVGLLWFCAKCREDVARKEELESGGENQDEELKKVTVEALELLPMEIWTKVFQCLSGYQLRQVRMTCRSWNQIVGGSRLLMKKIVLRLPKGIILDQECEQAELFSSCKRRYLHIVLNEIRIIDVNPWWPSIAENLECLIITKCKITVQNLVYMLSPLKNLKKLTLTCGPFVDLNYHYQLKIMLPSLEKLTLKDVDQAKLLDVFGHFRRLKVFKLSSGSCTETHPDKVIKLINSVKDTLEGLELPMIEHLWQTINAIDGLCLSWISLTNCTEKLAMTGNHVVNLIQKYPRVEALLLPPNLFLQENIIEVVRNNLTNLRYLKISYNTRENSVAYLRQMPQLIQIDIVGNDNYYGTAVDFIGIRNNNLKFLTLNNLKISKSYSTPFPNVTHINLNKCTFLNWSQIFNSKLESLRSVTLQSVSVVKKEEFLAAYFHQMVYLSVTDCLMSKSLLTALFSLCPNLAEARLINLDEVDDSLILVLCRKLKHLRIITINGCYKTTKLTQEHIEKHCRAIESINIDKKHVSEYREDYYEDGDDYDYSCGHEFVYDYSF